MQDKTQLLEYLITRIETIDKKVDKLLEFKWKIYGMALVTGVIGAGLMEFVLKFLLTKGG